MRNKTSEKISSSPTNAILNLNSSCELYYADYISFYVCLLNVSFSYNVNYSKPHKETLNFHYTIDLYEKFITLFTYIFKNEQIKNNHYKKEAVFQVFGR